MDEAGDPREADDGADAAWLAALGGRVAAASSDESSAAAQALREAAALRHAMLAYPPQREAAAGDDAARIERFLDRARDEGLLAVRSRPAAQPAAVLPPGGAGRIPAKRFAAPAALLVAVVLAVAIWSGREHGPAGDDAVRGTADAVVLVRDASPAAARRRLVDALAAEGVRVTEYTRFGRLGVDADLPRPLPDAVRRTLEEGHVPVPADGVLRVEYDTPP